MNDNNRCEIADNERREIAARVVRFSIAWPI